MSDTYRTPDSPLGRALAQGRLAAAAQRAEREELDKNGKPKRKPWKPPVDRTPPHDAATPAKTSRPKAGNRAPKAHTEKKEKRP